MGVKPRLFLIDCEDDRPLLDLTRRFQPATYPDGTRDEVTEAFDVIADLAASGDGPPEAA